MVVVLPAPLGPISPTRLRARHRAARRRRRRPRRRSGPRGRSPRAARESDTAGAYRLASRRTGDADPAGRSSRSALEQAGEPPQRGDRCRARSSPRCGPSAAARARPRRGHLAPAPAPAPCPPRARRRTRARAMASRSSPRSTVTSRSSPQRTRWQGPPGSGHAPIGAGRRKRLQELGSNRADELCVGGSPPPTRGAPTRGLHSLQRIATYLRVLGASWPIVAPPPPPFRGGGVRVLGSRAHPSAVSRMPIGCPLALAPPAAGPDSRRGGRQSPRPWCGRASWHRRGRGRGRRRSPSWDRPLWSAGCRRVPSRSSCRRCRPGPSEGEVVVLGRGVESVADTEPRMSVASKVSIAPSRRSIST